MSETRIVPLDEERRFEPHELFFSLTDAKGVIRYGNDVFTRISGFEEDDLLGKPHNIIRHPDMPRAVFKLLWDYLEDGKSIAAYVKNLAKDGRYYWVLAVVVPTKGGYLSIRLKPSSPLFDAVKQAYAETLKLEKDLEKETGNRKTAMQGSLARLCEIIVAAGFENYDEFMSEALSQELKSREQHSHGALFSDAPTDGCGTDEMAQLEQYSRQLELHLHTLLSSVDAFKHLGAELASKYEVIQELGPSLQFLALNARMAASRLGDKGVVQAAVADALGGKSKQAETTIDALIDGMKPLRELTARQVFDIAVARFLAEVGRQFLAELRAQEHSRYNARVEESLYTVIRELIQRCQQVVQGMASLEAQNHTTEQGVRDLVGRIIEMKAIQLNGKIEAAGGLGRSDFSVIFNEASKHIQGGRQDCDALLDVLESSSGRIEEYKELEPHLLDLVERMTLVKIGAAANEEQLSHV